MPNFNCVVMDDESCVKADFKQIEMRQLYTEYQRANVTAKLKKQFKIKSLTNFQKPKDCLLAI